MKQLLDAPPGMIGGRERIDGALQVASSFSAAEILGIRDSAASRKTECGYFKKKMAMIARVQRRDNIKIHTFDARPEIGSAAWDNTMRLVFESMCQWFVDAFPRFSSREGSGEALWMPIWGPNVAFASVRCV